MDFGYPQYTEAKILSEFIKTDAYRMEVTQRPPMAVTNAVSWRSEGIRYKKNEVGHSYLFKGTFGHCSLNLVWWSRFSSFFPRCSWMWSKVSIFLSTAMDRLSVQMLLGHWRWEHTWGAIFFPYLSLHLKLFNSMLPRFFTWFNNIYKFVCLYVIYPFNLLTTF